MIIQSFISDSIPSGMPHLRLALYQGYGDSGHMEAVHSNLAVLKQAAAKARQLGVHLLSFPELYLTGYNVTDARVAHALADAIHHQGILGEVSKTAAEQGVALICPYPEAADVAGERRYYDSIIVFDSDGVCLKNYRKSHLWGGDERNNWSFGYIYRL